MIDPRLADPPQLTLDQLRRVQATLERRVAARDAANIRQVGFAPYRATGVNTPLAFGILTADRLTADTLTADKLTSGQPRLSLPVTAQFDVTRKLRQLPADRRIASVESVRLLERLSSSYLTLQLDTDVVQTSEIMPTGVRVDSGDEHATTSVVVRWTQVTPPPAMRDVEDAQDFRWRWGMLTVAHLFKNSPPKSAGTRVERLVHCGAGPESIRGEMIARGRIPGGPDISLIETGLDRLWFSGLLPQPAGPSLVTPSQRQLLRWIHHGTEGVCVGDGVTHNWRWQTFYPQLSIPQLGRLRHIVRYQSTAVHTQQVPFGPGSSGGVVVAGGIPIGIQIAATGPFFQEAFAQCFDVSLAWLKKQLRATALELVHVPLGAPLSTATGS